LLLHTHWEFLLFPLPLLRLAQGVLVCIPSPSINDRTQMTGIARSMGTHGTGKVHKPKESKCPSRSLYVYHHFIFFSVMSLCIMLNDKMAILNEIEISMSVSLSLLFAFFKNLVVYEYSRFESRLRPCFSPSETSSPTS
jgi:hypothetical protein